MAEVKLTKNELRAQQRRLGQLQKYLPTLQLKKAMLQVEVSDARALIEKARVELSTVREKAEGYAGLLSVKTSVDPVAIAKVVSIDKTYENIAGVEVPQLRAVVFEPLTYSLFETPAWVDGVVIGLRTVAEGMVRLEIAREKKKALEHELRQVSIRVNLFEKVLIPRSQVNIKKIKVFLGDQELSAVGRAKVAKGKIESKRLSEKAQERSHAV